MENIYVKSTHFYSNPETIQTKWPTLNAFNNCKPDLPSII